MSLLREYNISCPYCSQSIEIVVDTSVKSQEYVEDCQICCRPILLSIQWDANNEVNIQARQENE